MKKKRHENGLGNTKKADALLVVNLKRHGIDNYIGGNTLFEMAAGYFSEKKIFLLNPIPKIKYYESFRIHII